MIFNAKFRNYVLENELCSGLAMYFPLNLIYYESGSKYKNGSSILILILRKAIKQAMISGVDSGGAGDARAPPEFGGSEKRAKPDFCFSEFS